MNRSGVELTEGQRSGGTPRSKLKRLRAAWTWGVALLVVAATVSLPGPGHAGDLHALRTDLAEARAALRVATIDGATVSRTYGFAHGASGIGARGRRSDRDPGAQRRLEAADRRVRAAEAALEAALADAGSSPPLLGFVEQVRSLLGAPADPRTAGRLQVPVRGVVTSGFGPRRLPSWDEEVLHEGIDVFALPGTPVRAAADGVVLAAAHQRQAGLSVTVDHGVDDHGRGLRTAYSHLSRIDVTEGERVRAGQVIGAVGNTGLHSTGPHLHFEVHLEGEPVDPRAWF